MGFSRQNNEVDCHFLLQGFFLTQGLNLCFLHLLHWQAGFLSLVPPGKPDTHTIQKTVGGFLVAAWEALF